MDQPSPQQKSLQSNLPHSFKGRMRVYKTIGVQGDTIYGMNVNLDRVRYTYSIELVFACIGSKVPADSPFKVRGSQAFTALYQHQEGDDLKNEFVKVPGQQLNKIVQPLGKDVTSFELLQHLKSQMPVMKDWLDSTLENAGIMQAYNDVDEIFDFFFGVPKNTAEVVPLQLPVLASANKEMSPFDWQGMFPTLETKSDPGKPTTLYAGVDSPPDDEVPGDEEDDPDHEEH